jgi:hypothetical protein
MAERDTPLPKLARNILTDAKASGLTVWKLCPETIPTSAFGGWVLWRLWWRQACERSLRLNNRCLMLSLAAIAAGLEPTPVAGADCQPRTAFGSGAAPLS